jgi:archaemetzincin
MKFTPPSLRQRIEAIGAIGDAPVALRRALESHEDFAPLPLPGPSDWLAVHPEPGQTFERFRRARPNRPDAQRHTLHLQPLGAFGAGESPALEKLEAFASAFFTLPVRMLPTVDIDPRVISERRNPYTRNRQLLTTDILKLLAQRLPPDAYALLAITMEDLYPDPAWNFVFGQASLRGRVGVYSFARYDPRFYGDSLSDSEALLLRRSCKVLAHEMTHMFGVEHCIYFHCLMNGSNHLAESDARPMHLCPVDLRKLHESIGFDVEAWYRGLLDVSLNLEFTDEAEWLKRRIERIRS